jgi:hypothetical protein
LRLQPIQRRAPAHRLTRLILTILLIALPQMAAAQASETWVVS